MLEHLLASWARSSLPTTEIRRTAYFKTQRASRGCFARVVVVGALLGPTSAAARNWRIVPDGSGDAPTIQAGVDSASAGDVVLLAPGTYSWTSQASNPPSMLRLAPGVSLRGEAGAAVTILDAESMGRVLECVDAGPVVIEDLTLQNGLASEANGRGGGIDARGASLPAVRRCVFRANVATGGSARGGAIACVWAGIEDCEFVENVAALEGPTNGHGGAIACTDAEIVRCTFRGNRVRGFEAASGGAVEGISPRIVDCVFEDNEAASAGTTIGGAVRATGSPLLSRCAFRRNVVDGHYFSATAGAASIGSGSVTDCLFLDNVAKCERGPGRGGALVGDELTVQGSVFVGNAALRTNPQGAGQGGAIFAFFRSVIEHSTFVGNSGGTPDGVACLDLSEGGTLRSVLITHTTLGQTCRGDATWSCSLLFDNVSGNTVCGTDAGGNMSADPLFCTDPRTAGDVSIHADSPCAAGSGAGDCGGIGAGVVACAAEAVEARTWSDIKSLYRGQSAR